MQPPWGSRGALGRPVGWRPCTFTLAAPSSRPSASGAPAASYPHPSCPHGRCELLGSRRPLSSVLNAFGSRLGSWGPHTGSDLPWGPLLCPQPVCAAAVHGGPVPFQETDHPGPCSWCSWCSNNAHPLAPGEQADPARPEAQPAGAVPGQPPVLCSFALCGPCKPRWAPRGSTLLIFLPRTSLFMEPLTLFPSTHTHTHTHTHTPHSAEQLERAWVGDRSCHLPQPRPWASRGGSLRGEFTGLSVLFIWGLRGVLRAACGSSSLARDRTGAPTLGAWSLSHAPPGESQSSLLFQDITQPRASRLSELCPQSGPARVSCR